MAILRCKVHVNEVGVKQFVPFALEDDKKATLINDGVVAFNVFPKGDKIDMRTNPPFVQILPCPFCGSENANKHDPLSHVDSRLGTSEAEVQKLAKEKGISTVEAANRLLQLRQG